MLGHYCSAPKNHIWRFHHFFCVIFLCAVVAGCSPTRGELTLGAIGLTALGAHSPTNEIEQIYYIGAFDPLGQHEPQMYRIRVHGQASFISQVDFASGWVRADMIDSLGTTVSFNKEKGGVVIERADQSELTKIGGGRKLFQFGPEGTRKVPEDHRLVIVMGSSPQAFFEAMDGSLATISKTIAGQANNELMQELFTALRQVQSETKQLEEVQKDLSADIKTE